VITFSVDVWRFTPLAAVGIAVLVNIVNLRNVLNGQLSAEEGLTRFAIALFLSLVAVGSLSRLLTAYARQLAQSEAERDEETGSSSTGTGR
jgi:hypothetical protein